MKFHIKKSKTSNFKQKSDSNIKDDLKSIPLTEVKEKLKSSPDGLTQSEAKKRQEQYGLNEIKEKKTHPFLKFLTYFWGPIPWMIEVAMILSGFIKHWADFFIILALLFMNAIVGFWEEYQAANAIAVLKKNLAIKARVKRDGKWVNINAHELVPGDIVHLRIGDIIPADARLLDGDPIEVDQSALTGESLPVTKKSSEAVFSGAIIRRGEIDALVYAIGENTYFGKTTHLVQEAHNVSHFQRMILKIGNYLIIIAVFLVLLIIGIAILRSDPFLETLQFALVLTIAAIPVALPTILSVTMAIGALLLSKKNVIVSHLTAIEEMAGMDILCADKTGTLTQNTLSLENPFCIDNISPKQVIFYAALASKNMDSDAIDAAIVNSLENKEELKKYQVLHFQPFDPVHKYAQATVKNNNEKEFKVMKGAVQAVLKLCSNSKQVEQSVEKATNEFASRGFRSIAVAKTDNEKWQFLGILPLFDPLRKDAKETISIAQKIGVKIRMITGDHLAIAKEIAKKLGLGTNILDASSLIADNKFKQKDIESVEKTDGFAQVFPEHKFHIVDILQKSRHIVGMTGDGVNDAPALKKANCGIAVSSATDAARAASDIVLIKAGLSVIIDAIKESRKIFQRMNSYAIYRITETIRVLIFMTLSIVIFNFYPVTAIMIVMLSLLNDGAIISIAYDNVTYNNRPEAWNMKEVLTVATILGLIGVVATFSLLYLAKTVFKLDQEHIRTLIYLKLSVAGHLTIFITRTRKAFWS
ncbi:MAG: plasma-membrane proton-efflux P-type ATPase, partial [Thermoplasmata archaeon M8B2D]